MRLKCYLRYDLGSENKVVHPLFSHRQMSDLDFIENDEMVKQRKGERERENQLQTLFVQAPLVHSKL